MYESLLYYDQVKDTLFEHKHDYTVLKHIMRMVASNNAFLFGQNLLEQERENLDFESWQESILRALETHTDPAMFVVNVLITIGTVSGYKEVDPDFEYTISAHLVQALRCLLEASENKSNHQEPPPPLSSEPQIGGFFFDENFENPSQLPSPTCEEELRDLIMLDDTNSSKIPFVSLQSVLQPIKLQGSGPSAKTNLLDDYDVDTSLSLLQMAVLKPATTDLIDLSSSEILDGFPYLASPLQKVTMSPKKDSLIDRAEDDDIQEIDKGHNSELEKLFKTFDPHLGITNEAESPQSGQGSQKQHDTQPQKKDSKPIEQEDTNPTEHEDTNPTEHEDTSPADEEDTNPSDEEDTNPDDEGDINHTEQEGTDPDDAGLIQKRHRDKMLGEIVSGKCCLQAFLAIEVLEMEASLLEIITCDLPTTEGTSSYGWILARQLHEHGWFRESSFLVFEFLECTYRSPLSKGLSIPPMSAPSMTPISPRLQSTSQANKTFESSSQTGWSESPPLSISTKPNQNVPVYPLPGYTQIVVVDADNQLELLRHSLENSSAVGMDTEWLPWMPKYNKLRAGQVPRTAILQLACDFDSTVYIVDIVAFLKRCPDVEYETPRIVQVIGGLLNNPRILKIAYDWEGDQDLLEQTCPDFCQEIYQAQNFLDLRHTWFASRDYHEHSPWGMANSQLPTPPTSSSPLPSSSWSPLYPMTSVSLSGENHLTYMLWSEYQVHPQMQNIHGGLTGMLSRLCGYRLDKSQQVSNWEQRPLTDAQLVYAAVDAWCLLDIYAVLETIEKI
ncbi:Exonuclease mut-7 [Entomortierella lignicola]|nr:Exonuclease mut-7 [Entomortierella lignicola]